MIGCVFPLLADKTAIKDELVFKEYTEKRTCKSQLKIQSH